MSRFVLLTLSLACMNVSATEIVSLTWDHAVTVDVEKLNSNVRCTTFRNNASPTEIANEFSDELGCGQTVLNTGVRNNFREDFTVRSESYVSASGKIDGLIETVVQADEWDSDSIFFRSAVVLGFREVARTIDRWSVAGEMSNSSSLIIDTSVGRALNNEPVALSITLEGRGPVIPPPAHSLEVTDLTTGETLFSGNVSNTGIREEIQIPFRDRIGNQLRIDTVVDGEFSMPDFSFDEFTAAYRHPPYSSGSFITVTTVLGVPEPNSGGTTKLAFALFVMAIRACRREQPSN